MVLTDQMRSKLPRREAGQHQVLLQHLHRVRCRGMRHPYVCRREIDADDAAGGSHRIMKPLERRAGAAAGIQNAHARREREAGDGEPQLRFGERIEELQFARVVALRCITQKSAWMGRISGGHHVEQSPASDRSYSGIMQGGGALRRCVPSCK